MATSTDTLRELHRIHRQLGDLRERHAQGPKRIRLREANVERLRTELKSIQGENKAVRMAADQKELQLKTGEGKIEDLKTKLNACKSNREYQALREQIAADEMANSVLSDEILEYLEKIDEFQAHVVEAEANLAKGEEELARVREATPLEQGRIETDMDRLERELVEAENALPSDIRAEYNRMIQSKGPDGMAAVEDEICGGCYQSITPNNYNSLVLGKIVFCGTCGRLLYLPEDRSPGA